MDIGRFIEELMPVLIYGFFSCIMLYTAVKAFKAVRKINSEGIKVSAEVVGYSESKQRKIDRLIEKVYHITVSCIDPRTNTRKIFTITTNIEKCKRYAETETVDVIFMSDPETPPILPEELKTAKRVRYTAMFGGIFCVLFSSLVMVAIICYMFLD